MKSLLKLSLIVTAVLFAISCAGPKNQKAVEKEPEIDYSKLVTTGPKKELPSLNLLIKHLMVREELEHRLQISSQHIL